jgi:hypothetical protein
MRGLRSQRGQATVEWVGLLLAVALMFGALVAGGREAARGESADRLGEAVAQRITCAARGTCGVGELGPDAPSGRRPGGRSLAPTIPRSPARGVPPLRRLDRQGSLPLRAGVGVLEHAWVACFGYRRWRYELEHPSTPREAVPLHETLDTVNQCLNPLSFLFG